jgi:hypothetical protein
MKVNIKAFWNGSILSDMTLTKSEFKEVRKQLSKDFFEHVDNTAESIEYLDQKENELFLEYSKHGKYEISSRDMALHMLMINSLVKRGLRPNDDKYGLMIMQGIN